MRWIREGALDDISFGSGSYGKSDESGIYDPGSNRRSDGWYKRLIRLQFIGMRQDEGIINYNL